MKDLFSAKLIPTVKAHRFIGVRTPILREYAKELIKENQALEFINELPHIYYEENQLHAFILSEFKDYEFVVNQINRFLPYIDNWATCDQLRPKVFKKNTKELIRWVEKWLQSDQTYTIRFGIGVLNSYYLDEEFDQDYLAQVAKIRSTDYYVNMMIAWYFATALAKQYEKTLPFIENHALDQWVHNKAIQKARESRRVLQVQKNYLNSLKY
ncbi:hypothetical protein P261_02575 [Lachnospiraceae bacterium TWA4]|nr:hypothetical protein P261_02575 [Lachnospiraceae bacterium TWA4]